MKRTRPRRPRSFRAPSSSGAKPDRTSAGFERAYDFGAHLETVENARNRLPCGRSLGRKSDDDDRRAVLAAADPDRDDARNRHELLGMALGDLLNRRIHARLVGIGLDTQCGCNRLAVPCLAQPPAVPASASRQIQSDEAFIGMSPVATPILAALGGLGPESISGRRDCPVGPGSPAGDVGSTQIRIC